MTTAKIRNLSYIRKDDKWDSSRQELSPQVTEGFFRETSHITQKIPQEPLHRLK